MSYKCAKVAALIAGLQGRDWPARYLGFFDCFNRGLYYDAHDLLEGLWLPSRRESNDLFYKGLIQLAGAFVHFQKDRLRPAGALLRLARNNLAVYPAIHEGIQVTAVIRLVDDWLSRLQQRWGEENPFQSCAPPKLEWPD
ncbi:MAG: hypothetical protein M2R45_05056 [Verrucomicrobia subdivision 3 bacterium]|nr:hypothetical protein [Limisphaerales bacterium]